MLFKVINSIIIIISCTLIGFENSKKYIFRTRHLRELQGALSVLETEIDSFSTKLPEAMISIGESIGSETGEVFRNTGWLLNKKKDYTASGAWKHSIKLNKNNLSLDKEDIAILYRFGDQLGISDKEGQARYIRLTLVQLQQQEKKATELQAKYERMHKSLGILGGIGIALLLL